MDREERRQSIREGLADHVTDTQTADLADAIADFFSGEGITKITFANPEEELAE